MPDNDKKIEKGNRPTNDKQRPVRITASRDTFMLCTTHNLRFPKGAACPACASKAKRK